MLTNMKSFRIHTLLVASLLLMSSCFEDTKIVWDDAQVEFEDAVLRTPATGEIFPIIALNRNSGTPSYQVNLIGAQLAAPEDIVFSIEEVPDRLINATTIRAVEGVHYTLSGTTVTFAEQTSKTNFTNMTIVNTFPAQAGMSALLIIKLDGNNNIAPAENYRRLAFRISLN
jgi:hypothetical protein